MSNPVLVLIDHDRGAVDEAALQALAFARTCLPDATVVAVIIGGDAAPTVTGADSIRHIRHAELSDYAPEAWGDALHQLAVSVDPAAVVATGTERGNEVLAHAAAIADEPFAANVVAATPPSSDDGPWEIRRTRWGGSLLEDATLTATLPARRRASLLYRSSHPSSGPKRRALASSIASRSPRASPSRPLRSS